MPDTSVVGCCKKTNADIGPKLLSLARIHPAMQLSKHPSRHSFTSGSPLQGQHGRVRRCRTAPLLPITASVATPTRLPDQQQAQQASEPAPSVRALNKLIGGLAFWQAQQKAKADVETDDNVMEDAVQRGREVGSGCKRWLTWHLLCAGTCSALTAGSGATTAVYWTGPDRSCLAHA